MPPRNNEIQCFQDLPRCQRCLAECASCCQPKSIVELENQTPRRRAASAADKKMKEVLKSEKGVATKGRKRKQIAKPSVRKYSKPVATRKGKVSKSRSRSRSQSRSIVVTQKLTFDQMSTQAKLSEAEKQCLA